MVCQFERLIYPNNAQNIDMSSFMIAAYRPCEKIFDLDGNLVTQIKAVGYCLPISGSLRYDMRGKWNKNSKHGVQFEVETYDEVIIPNKDGIIAYLSSGQISGVGPKIAEKIYKTFGDKTLDILDQDPEQLLLVPGISEVKLKKIVDSYLTNRGARDVVAFLAPHGISANRAVKFYQKYGNKTMEIVKEHPYTLCELSGIGFNTADRIAKSMGFEDLAPDRVDAGIQYALIDAESRGHLCLEKHEFMKSVIKLLDTQELTEDMVANRALKMVTESKLECYMGFVYRIQTARAEKHLAYMVYKQLEKGRCPTLYNIESKLDAFEKRRNITMADEQRQAVITALSNGVSIITGGPGTGKTMIQRAILEIYKSYNPRKNICCCAPTGKAARRMAQSTGEPAYTVHKVLNIRANDDGSFSEAQKIDADLILIDEVSMLDIYLAGRVFDALKDTAQIVLIGDADQLPSVGPGAVLSELLESEQIPFVRLDKVFRQSFGSRIAENAKIIRHGNLNLDYGDDFQFISSMNLAWSQETIVELYKQEIAKYGVDNVAILSPYRQKTETGVNALNERIRDIVNPPARGKAEVGDDKKLFRLGDKVMQIKNDEDINNGAVGYIVDIDRHDNAVSIYIDFGEGRIVEYGESDLEKLSLGYASTIHKSQGSEYRSVIINLQCVHSIMLTRPLIYTAITRSKDRVIIVGERKALCIAINRTDTEKRGTNLATRLKNYINK